LDDVAGGYTHGVYLINKSDLNLFDILFLGLKLGSDDRWVFHFIGEHNEKGAYMEKSRIFF
jgi:hypothetical protein